MTAMAFLFIVICLVFAFTYPLIISLIPEATDFHYDGYSLKVVGSDCVELYVTEPQKAEIYIQIGDRRVLAREISISDLELAGFKRYVDNSFTNSRGGIFTLADFSEDDELAYLLIPSYSRVTLPFAASQSGPLLTLPVSFGTVVAQFGKPKSKKRLYPSQKWR
tara:strand:+ start:1237 stop:1728 length:492 start_codon:yes stop_codon:yes gene_type:complete